MSPHTGKMVNKKTEKKTNKIPPSPFQEKEKKNRERKRNAQRENETPKQREWQRKIGIERLAETNTKLNYSTRRTKRQNKKIMERR